MASSNRHWPSMFKSKPCKTHHQLQHDSNSCNRAPYTSGCDQERSPEPKPRWNPKPEQIRILEAIFNSGMVNPPRDEIRKIRAQLQEYGQVGDANVFYWFQNRKSRSKHKLRHLHNSKNQSQQTENNPPINSLSAAINASSSSSSSSEKSSPKAPQMMTTSKGAFANYATDASNSPTASVNHTFFQSRGEHIPQPFFFPVQQIGDQDHQVRHNGGKASFAQGFCFYELSNVVHVPEHDTVGPCTSLLISEIMNHGDSKESDLEDEQAMKFHHQQNYAVTTHPIFTHTTSVSPSTIATSAGVGESGAVGMGGPAKSTVFINEVAFEVATGPFNVREAFGDSAVLIHSTGQPVFTNDWGVTLEPLLDGAFYYLT